MDEDIGEVIAGHMESSPIVIQAKCEGGNGPIGGPRVESVRRQGLLELIPRHPGELHTGIVPYIGPVVKMPCAVQRIAVYGEYEQGQDKKGKDIFSAREMRCILMNVW